MMQCLICLFNSLSTNVTRQSLKRCVQFESRFVHDHANGGTIYRVTSNAKKKRKKVDNASSRRLSKTYARALSVPSIRLSPPRKRNLNNTPKTIVFFRNAIKPLFISNRYHLRLTPRQK